MSKIAVLRKSGFRPPNRREVLGLALGALVPVRAQQVETHQATGVRTGEVSSTSAVIWGRRTRDSLRRADGLVRKGQRGTTLPVEFDISSLQGSCPGEEGQLRVIVRQSDGKKVHDSGWGSAGAASDFTRQFTITKLRPDTAHTYTMETRAGAGMKVDGVLTGQFRTAPAASVLAPVTLAMMSCQKYSQTDSPGGFLIYDAIRKMQPHAYLSVGDNVYYDSDDPVVNSVEMARYHWHRMFSQAKLVECLRAVPGYWVKDDHDCYSDDCWPGMVNETMNPFTFEQGLKIFPEQVPMGPRPYRSFRWGRALEIWLLEGRDYRTANPTQDGPSKSIWGPRQKRWLQQSLTASDAHWKLIISPTPVVGPDRANKKDNHSNRTFATEGTQFRKWLAGSSRGDTFVLCGDRHWQYHSIDPETKVEEFGCGAASDSHASGSPGETPRYHRFHRMLGGFLAIQVLPEGQSSRLLIEHRNVAGEKVYERSYPREA
ncbi:MAG: alkaline phosphatase [Acidimicrobiia bacterium]|nr:alkaline phosphatase [Acidimicrobiia bacterium]